MVNVLTPDTPGIPRARTRRAVAAPCAPPAVTPAVTVRAIRGATTVDADEPCAVWAATRELLEAMLERNALGLDDLISALFTVTPDLTSTFPARVTRQMGWADVPMLCALEIPVPDALPRCVRVLLHATSPRPRGAIAHVYLRGAVTLRPDLCGPVLDGAGG